VDLQSYLGKGTTIKIKIPLTLAIVRAVIIQSNGKRFAIPQVNIQELVRLDADRVRTEIESVHGVPVYRMRGRLLPLVYLNEELKLAKQAGKEADDGPKFERSILVRHSLTSHVGIALLERNQNNPNLASNIARQTKDKAAPPKTYRAARLRSAASMAFSARQEIRYVGSFWPFIIRFLSCSSWGVGFSTQVPVKSYQ